MSKGQVAWPTHKFKARRRRKERARWRAGKGVVRKVRESVGEQREQQV